MGSKLSYLLLTITIASVLFILSPFEIGFVVSGSMAPTIQPESDLFIINSNADSVEDFNQDDIVTFYSPDRNRLTTHRVVNVTDRGLITQGDASLQTDQNRGEPPVTDELITGRVVEYSGGPVIFPGGGTISTFIIDYNTQILIFLLVLLVVQSLIPNMSSQSRKRHIRPYRIIFIFSVILLIMWSGAIFINSDVVSGPNYVVTENVIESNPQSLDIGKSTEAVQTFNISSGFVPTHSEYESVGAGKITDVEVKDGSANIEYTIGPYDSKGVHTPEFEVYSYPKTLPESVISNLHNIHPTVASAATLAIVMLPAVILILLYLDNSPIRTQRSRILRNFLED